MTAAAAFRRPAAARTQQQQSSQAQGQQAEARRQVEQRQMASRQQVQQSLQQAGFSKIVILETAYLVGGTTPQGERVLMIVNTETGQATVAGPMEQDAQGQSGGGN